MARPDRNEYNKYIFKINEGFRKHLSNFNINLIALIPLSSNNYLVSEESDLNFSSLIEGIKMCDGIIIHGGFGPFDFDYKVIDYIYKNDIPVLGICLGLQVMGEYLKGKVDVLDNKKHNKPRNYQVHDIKIVKNTKLYEIINKETITVNSRHNSALLEIAKKYISAKHGDIIEAIEDKEKKFFMGVQWHPEDLDDENSFKIFESFINKLEEKNDKYKRK